MSLQCQTRMLASEGKLSSKQVAISELELSAPLRHTGVKTSVGHAYTGTSFLPRPLAAEQRVKQKPRAIRPGGRAACIPVGFCYSSTPSKLSYLVVCQNRANASKRTTPDPEDSGAKHTSGYLRGSRPLHPVTLLILLGPCAVVHQAMARSKYDSPNISCTLVHWEPLMPQCLNCISSKPPSRIRLRMSSSRLKQHHTDDQQLACAVRLADAIC